jgi:hypothetical protein
MEDSMASADVALSEDDLARLDAAAPMGSTAGTRYREPMMKMVRI